MRFGGMFHGLSFGVGFELMRRVVAPAILVATPLFLWWWLGPEKPSCDAARCQAARTVVARAAESVRTVRGDLRRAAVLHLVNDPTDFVTKALRERLMDGGMLDLDGTPPLEKIRNVLNLRTRGTDSVEEARAYGRRRGLDAVLVGRLDRFETVQDKAVLEGTLKFVRVVDGTVVDIPFTQKASGGGAAAELAQKVEAEVRGEASAPLTLTTRVLLMVLSVVLLPIFTFPFLKMATRSDSNLAAAIALALLLAADSFIISAFVGVGSSFFGLAVFLVLLAAAFGYDLFMLSYAKLSRPALPTV